MGPVTGQRLAIAPLTAAAFAPFGEVIEAEGRASYPINAGTARRFDDLARVDVGAAGGKPLVGLCRAEPIALPFRVRLMERHPLGSQAFMPLSPTPFLVVVAPPSPAPRAEAIRAFRSNGRQGINYARGTWHHPLLALERTSDFLILDRGGEGENCEEVPVEDLGLLIGA